VYSLNAVLGLLGYIVFGRIFVRCLRGFPRDLAFAALNVAGVYLFLFHGSHSHYVLRFGIYLALVVFQYVLLVLFAERQGWLSWLAFFTPIAALIIFRYVPDAVFVAIGHALNINWPAAPTMVGISYLAFRSSHLVLEVRNGAVKRPSLCQYFGFCFFLPTVPVGPINPYSNHIRAFSPDPPAILDKRASLRILVGLVKYLFLGSLCNRLSYSGLLLDEHPHHWIDLPVAILFYYLFLYCNFSGFCDMAIGAAGLIGIPVAENFDNPFAARNIREFWNRWHITLSTYMRDVVFAPLSKYLARLFGRANVNHAIALTIFIVFLLIGIWHGAGWNFAAYGAVHGIGVVTNHYYTLGLKHWLGRDGFKAYNGNPIIRALAVALTFSYCAASLMLFANTFPQIKTIFSSLR
jgi:D-alanyl-lipoteichoic acid acyltransferase DltB (MBOAT superfamily)